MYERGTMWCPKCGSTNTLATTLVEECLDCGFSKHYHYWDHDEPNFDSAYNKPIPEITIETNQI
jgi:predicted nucleic-acid-binding Zn-ribbon protein